MRLLSVALGIATTASLAAQQLPDRSAPPEPGPVAGLVLPAIQKHTLSNGLPVWIVELHKVPVVAVSLAVRSGSGADPATYRSPGYLPSVGQIMQAITDGVFDGQAYDDAYPERVRQTIY